MPGVYPIQLVVLWGSAALGVGWDADGMRGVMWEQPEKGHLRGRRARSRF